jgi:hypothetical protein
MVTRDMYAATRLTADARTYTPVGAPTPRGCRPADSVRVNDAVMLKFYAAAACYIAYGNVTVVDGRRPELTVCDTCATTRLTADRRTPAAQSTRRSCYQRR